MRGRFTGRCRPVMAADAGPRCLGMIEPGNKPGTRSVAGIAIARGRHMRGRLPCRGRAIMAAGARAGHRRMVHPRYRAPHRR